MDTVILKVIRELQPVSSEKIFLKVCEEESIGLNLSQKEIIQRLERMEKDGIIEKIRLKNEKGKFIPVRGLQFDEFFCYPEYWICKGKSDASTKPLATTHRKKRSRKTNDLAKVLDDRISYIMNNKGK